MLIRDILKSGVHDPGTRCDYCQEPAVIQMHGYGDSQNGNCNWCADCGLQLIRKITEDLCALLTKSGRHG